MWFIHALDAIFELTAVVRKLLSHFIDAAWKVATERGPNGDNLADFELVGGHRFLDPGRDGGRLSEPVRLEAACPLRVISRRSVITEPCPLYPRCVAKILLD
jgi:hypothetical protein